MRTVGLETVRPDRGLVRTQLSLVLGLLVNGAQTELTYVRR